MSINEYTCASVEVIGYKAVDKGEGGGGGGGGAFKPPKFFHIKNYHVSGNRVRTVSYTICGLSSALKKRSITSFEPLAFACLETV